MTDSHDPAAPLDAVGDQQRAGMVAGALANVQRQLFELDLNQTANDVQDDGRLADDPRPVSERRDALKRAEKNLREKFAYLMPLVERLIANQQQ